MSAPLLATKFSFPTITKYLVERPSLVEKLRDSLAPGIRMMLISAPAGFGKTTLVSAWISDVKQSNLQPDPFFAWVSLDHRDNDPVVFWSYVLSSLHSQCKPVGKQPMNLLQVTSPPDLEGCLGLLINELAEIPNPFSLILDDYHLIRNPTIHTSLAFLVDHIPSQFHVVVLSRTDPPLPLALLRSRGQLLQIRLNDLRFSTDEANSFLNSGMGLNLDSQVIEILNQKTEGWVAGLQLAALSLREAVSVENRGKLEEFIASFSGSSRYILDFLIEEVLNQQSGEIQNFLLMTSILDRLCAPLCDALFEGGGVGEQSDSQKLLEYLDSYNLFILPLDDQRYWYRYHQLFADLLRKRLSQINPGVVPELHRRAIQWYENNGFISKAVEHAFLLKDYPKAASLISQVVEEMWGRGEHLILLEWIAALPEEEKRRYPQLWVFQVSMLITAGKMQEAERFVVQIEDYLKSSREETLERGSFMGKVYSLRTYIASFYRDIPNLIQYARLALENLDQDEDAARRCGISTVLGNAYLNTGELQAAGQTFAEAIIDGKKAHLPAMVLTGMENLVLVLYTRGELKRADQICQDGLLLIQQNGLDQSPMAANLFISKGLVLCESHNLDGAEKYIQRGLELAQARNYIWSIAWGYHARLRLLLAQNRLVEAERVAQNAEELASIHEIPEYHTCRIAALNTLVWIRLGKIDQAEKHLRSRNIILGGDIHYPHESEYCSLASLYLAKGDLDSGMRLLERLLLQWEEGNQSIWLGQLLILQSLFLQARGDREKSLQSLEKALGLAETGGYLQIFLDEGQPLFHLLEEAIKENIHSQSASRLWDAFHTTGSGASMTTNPEITAESVLPGNLQPDSGNNTLFEPLTKREMEILRLIVEGYANKEIAQELYLSLRTVKYYATRIYGKLGVSGRTQASYRARELGLIK